MESSLKMLIFHIWKSESFRIFEMSQTVCAVFRNFELLKFRFFRFWSYEHFKSWKVEDEDRTMINFGSRKSPKAWIGISYRSKTWNDILVNRTNFSIFKQPACLINQKDIFCCTTPGYTFVNHKAKEIKESQYLYQRMIWKILGMLGVHNRSLIINWPTTCQLQELRFTDEDL